MAKIGQADSRWIVSRRSDGKNVDNWHWTEKDLFPLCKKELEKAFKSLAIPSTNAKLKINKAESVEGDMNIFNRKGKAKFIFDVQLKLGWEGELKETVKDGEEEKKITGKGTIHVDDISNESKWKISVKMENETNANRVLKQEVQNNVGPLLDNVINPILAEMEGNTPVQEEVGKSQVITEAKPVRTDSRPVSPTVAPHHKYFVQKLIFDISPNTLYESLLNENYVCGFTGCQAKIENRINGEFNLLDGLIQGIQLELVPQKKIVQKWRFNSWPSSHYSHVTLELEEDGTGTMLTLTHKDIPLSDFDNTKGTWESHFWQKMRLFGYNYEILV